MTTPATRPARSKDLLRCVTTVLLSVLLNARGAQAGEAMLVDRILPGQEFLDGERVTTARFLERKQTAAHSCHHLGFAPDDPPFRARCRQIGDRQRTAVRP